MVCSLSRGPRTTYSGANGADLDDSAREQIKTWIRSTGITQTALAAHIGRNQAWMSRYLKGEFNADLETLQRITRMFGHELTAALNVPADPEEATLVALYRSLSADGRRVLMALLKDWTRPRRRGRSPKPFR